MAEMMMNDGKKYIVQDEEYASKGVAGTALGIGIGALALTVLGRNGLQNILGTGCGTEQTGCGVTCKDRLADTKELHSEMFGIYKSQVDADFGLYKSQRDADDAIVAKHNADAFSLYKYSRDGFDVLNNEISNLKTKVAVNEAVEMWKNKAIYDAIALEAERRACADGKIVNYSNQMFYPVQVADVTTTGSTARTVFNPLCCCGNWN